MTLLALVLTAHLLPSAHAAGAPAASDDPQGVVSTVTAHRSELAHCYGEALSADPWAGGTATARLHVARTGFVQSASLDSSALPASANDCVLDVLRGVSFPQLIGQGAVIVVPFDFSAS